MLKLSFRTMIVGLALCTYGLTAVAEDGATIKGKTFWKEGETPDPRKLVKMSADPKCEQINAGKRVGTENSIVNKSDSTLRNVILYVSAGLDSDGSYDTPKEPVMFDQEGCMYKPHVLSFMTGQAITIRNSDPTLHNVHGQPKENPEFNFGQPKQGMEKEITLKKAEIFKVKCDVHPWMVAWMGAFDHPFHTVSNEKGEFEIKDLPPGNYTITAWHEVYGSFTQKVTVSTGETKELNFTLDWSVVKK